MLRILSLFFLTAFLSSVSAQEDVLTNYIKYGLENNLSMKQKEFSLQKSLAELSEARGYFFPSIGINARYTRAGGGRTFDIPIGDLMNPVYQALNIPIRLQNEQINFFREKEQETKISLVQPIFQPAIYYNYKIKSNLSDIQEFEKEIFTRTLISEIKSAYYNYLKTLQLEKLLNDTKLLLQENLRVSQSLFDNDKVTKDVVYRAETELRGLEQQITEAENSKKLAQSYFNFLLNKPLEESIIIMEAENDFSEVYNIEDLEDSALRNREELQQLGLAVETADNTAGLSRSNFFPGISLAVDYGFQGEQYRFKDEDDFWMASVVLQWNLFNGFRDNAKIEQAEMQKNEYQTKYDEVVNRIKLEVRQALYDFQVVKKSIITAGQRLKSALKTFEIVNKKYSEGIASQIEFIDARTTKTQAEINMIITKYDYQIKLALLEKAVGSDEITN